MRHPKRATGLILALTLVFTTITGATASDASTSVAGPRVAAACQRPHVAGQFSRYFFFRSKRRTFQLYVPKSYTGTTLVPLVFDFHGFGSNAVQQMFYGNFKPESERHDFLIVAPDGQGKGAGRHFNFGSEPGLQNDVNMVQALLTHVERAYCIDATRVYSTGMSDGGAMTSVLACVAPDKFAAFAPVAVVFYCGVKGKRPVAIDSFQGTADPIVPFKGGTVHCCGGGTVPSKPASMAKWAAFDHCATYHDVRLGSQVVRRTWKGCADGSTVVFYIIVGGGHTWPGSIPIPRLGLTTKQIDASALIWQFFAAHKLAA